MTIEELIDGTVRRVLREELARLHVGADDNQPITYEQAAAYASCSEETIGEWVRLKLLTPTGKGKLRRVTRAGVRRALELLAAGEGGRKPDAPAARAASILRSIK